MWLLARQMGLPISLGAAYTTMAFTGVVLSLPNAPGLVGQFHAAIKLGLLAYLPASVVNARGMAYAIVLHGIQTAYPRVSKLGTDPDNGLASVEALFAAYRILGRPTVGLLDQYRWGEEFLRVNGWG